MKLQQMAFMLVVIIIFFTLVGIFALRFHMAKMQGIAQTLEDKNALLLVSKLANSPEFSCGESFRNTKLSCIDMDKVMALKKEIGKYDGFWGVKNIEIKIIYPAKEEIPCTSGNYPNCNLISLRENQNSGYDFHNFVLVCHKQKQENGFYDKCELGRLMIFNEKK